MVGHFLKCSSFLEEWDLQHGLADSGMSVTLFGYEFSDEVTGEQNNAFPEDPNSEIEDACDVWIRPEGYYDESDPFPCYGYRTATWSLANGIPDDEETDDEETDDEATDDVEGFLCFHGREIFPPEIFKCDCCYKEMESMGWINQNSDSLCEACAEDSLAEYDGYA